MYCLNCGTDLPDEFFLGLETKAETGECPQCGGPVADPKLTSIPPRSLAQLERCGIIAGIRPLLERNRRIRAHN